MKSLTERATRIIASKMPRRAHPECAEQAAQALQDAGMLREPEVAKRPGDKRWAEVPPFPKDSVEVVMRWPGSHSSAIHLTKTPGHFIFDDQWFDRVDDPDTGEFLGIYVMRPDKSPTAQGES